ncbi:MAG TPA: right-handed parallel beta-helix repeat-containing protein, partial [Roseiflexaceae bacterium]|nr:right-handed parallel beta-helix repeat-containing protein [Roseiflexaceae bacterium]
AITIVGLAGAATTIIDGNGAGPVVTCNSFEGSNTVLQGLTIRGGRTQQSGAGMLIALASPTVISCLFDDNRAWISGGGISMAASSASIIDCTFTQNHANNSVQNNAGTGGAISIIGGSPEINGCTFTNNTARFHGGALSVASGATPDIEDCTFSTNVLLVSGHGLVGVAPAMGSAIFVNASNPTFGGCEVSGNVVRARGAIGVYGGEASFVGCTISDNISHATKGATGGAMYVINNANVSLLGCQFTGNQSREDGGALKIVSSTVNATLCGFLENEGSTWGGGAIGVNNGATATFAGCTFVDNSSGTRAGAIYAIDSTLTLGGCTFATNHAATQGGAIYAQQTDISVDSCTFDGNISAGAGMIQGGGAILYWGGVDTVATIHNSTFSGNSALLGGAVRLQGETNITDCVFEANHADQEGGAIASEIVAQLNIRNSQFLDNTTDGTGGAIVCNAESRVVGCLFSGNSAASGGAIFADEGLYAYSRFYGCRFSDNTASTSGGAVEVGHGGFIWLANCVIENNTAPFGKGAVSVVTPVATMLNMVNCAVVNNSGGGLYV